MRETKMKKVLAVVLAFAMVLAMGVMTFAATEATPSLEEVSNDGKTIVLSLKSNGNASAFDFGVTYESDKVSLTKSTWNSDFSAAYDDVSGIKAKNDQKDYSYVVLGGTAPEATYDGEIATLEFAIADGVTGDIEFSVCKDSADLKKAIDAAGDPKPLKDAEGFSAEASVKTDAAGTAAQDPTDPPAGQDPTQAPVAQDPTQAPAGQDPTQAPAGQNPTQAPVNTTTAPTTTKTSSPKTGDAATVVIPMVAIVAAAAAVVVASKKKVED